MSRRMFLGGAVAALAGTGVYTWQIEPHWLEIVHRPLPVSGLPAALQGATLAQLSDLHVGARVSDAYILDTFQRVRDLAPDIVVYTGDFTSYHQEIVEHAERMYRNAPRGRLATLGILGNHDYGPNWAHPEIADRIVTVMQECGIRVLRNQIEEVLGLQIVGMDDLWGTHLNPAQVLAPLESARAAVVLSHNPDSVDLPGWDRFHGWVLSGHTHGGQCKAPFLPPPLLPVKNRRYTSGAFDLAGDRRMYISRGVGHLTQVRFNVRPEVTLFELTTS